MSHIIAMSGGVDSSAALYLRRQKYPDASLLGVTLSLASPASALHENDLSNIRDAASVCQSQGIEHRALDVHEAFRKTVMDYFSAEYLSGRTPNPCVVCNRAVKFGLLADYADENGCGRIITGHYARLEEIDGYIYIKKAADCTKDQSYVLASLSQDQLRRAEFPLGEYTKAQIRALAEEQNLISARRRDSQDICFIPDGDYVRFIRETTGISPEPGDYVSEDGTVLGRHKGHWCYTIGQRKGLGISMGKHVFVLEKDARTNRVTLGNEDGLYKKRVAVRDLHFPSDPNTLENNPHCSVKLRYSASEACALFHRTGEKEGILEFRTEQRAPTPGQYAVMYKGGYVIASAVIV
ncbi:MAG: tRNA 2-thiouridine(34) synthase MnmA [Clostridia bacterium]|nr:tRNA 2-thiouridine(34) synthase MnmA [Clostridia bacterium]